jgi:uncharacterized protein (DUF169 family)
MDLKETVNKKYSEAGGVVMTRKAAQGLMLRDLLGDGTDPVAVFLLAPGQEKGAFAAFEPVRSHRYCQALMKARHGESVLLEPAGLSCPAAAAAFGFRPLPPQLANGKGLMGFGIVADEAVGKRMFAGMPRLAEASISSIALCPLRLAPRIPDVVVVEGLSEVLMWLLLADLNVQGGERRIGDTAVLQATCVDATVIPYLKQRLNFSLGCYGCREATDLTPGETVLGFPGTLLEPLLGALEMLRSKAISRSRAKLAHECLVGAQAETTGSGASTQENHNGSKGYGQAEIP